MPILPSGSGPLPPPPSNTGLRIVGDRSITFTTDDGYTKILAATYPIVQSFNIDGGDAGRGVLDASLYNHAYRTLPAPGTNFVADAIRTAFWANGTGGTGVSFANTFLTKGVRSGLEGIFNMNSGYNLHHYKLYTGHTSRVTVALDRTPLSLLTSIKEVFTPNMPLPAPNPVKNISDPSLSKVFAKSLNRMSLLNQAKVQIGVPAAIAGAASLLIPQKVDINVATIPEISVPDSYNPSISTFTKDKTDLNPYDFPQTTRPADRNWLISDNSAGIGIGITSVGNSLEAPIQYMHWFQIFGCTDQSFLTANGMPTAKQVPSGQIITQGDENFGPSNSGTSPLLAPNGDPYFWGIDNFNNPTNVFYFGGAPAYPWYTPQYFLDIPFDSRPPTARGKTVYYTLILCRGFWFQFANFSSFPQQFVVLPPGNALVDNLGFPAVWGVELNTNGFIYGFSITDVLGAGQQVNTAGQGQPFGADFP